MNTDQYLQRVLHLIEKYGWAVQGVLADARRPSFAYTVGLMPTIGSEVMVVGLDGDVAKQLLNNLAGRLLAGEVELVHGAQVEGIVRNYPVTLIEVSDRGEYFTGVADQLMNHGQQQVPLFQMVWPLADGSWPWQRSSGQDVLGPAPV